MQRLSFIVRKTAVDGLERQKIWSAASRRTFSQTLSIMLLQARQAAYDAEKILLTEARRKALIKDATIKGTS